MFFAGIGGRSWRWYPACRSLISSSTECANRGRLMNVSTISRSIASVSDKGVRWRNSDLLGTRQLEGSSPLNDFQKFPYGFNTPHKCLLYQLNILFWWNLSFNGFRSGSSNFINPLTEKITTWRKKSIPYVTMYSEQRNPYVIFFLKRYSRSFADKRKDTNFRHHSKRFCIFAV